MIIGIDAKTIGQKQKTGVENYTEQLLRYLAKIDSKNEYWLYSPKRIPKLGPNFKNKIVDFPFAWTQVGLSLEFSKSSPAPDLFFSPAHSLPLYCPMRSVVTIHDVAFLDFPKYFTPKDLFRLKMVTRQAVKKADKIIAVSKSTKKDIVKYYQVPAKKVEVIYSAYDKKLFKPTKKTEIVRVLKKYKIKEPYLIYVGTLQKRKNIPRLISAFAYLKKKYQIPHQLVIVGKKGWLYDEIFQKVREGGLRREVIFTGFAKNSDLPGLLSGVDVFVLPSLYEGFGLPILEAMACGTPVVASKVSSLPELVEDNGVLVNPESVSSIAKGIYKIISNPKLKKQLSKKGLEGVKEFSWKKCAQKTLKALEAVGRKNAKRT